MAVMRLMEKMCVVPGKFSSGMSYTVCLAMSSVCERISCIFKKVSLYRNA